MPSDNEFVFEYVDHVPDSVVVPERPFSQRTDSLDGSDWSNSTGSNNVVCPTLNRYLGVSTTTDTNTASTSSIVGSGASFVASTYGSTGVGSSPPSYQSRSPVPSFAAATDRRLASEILLSHFSSVSAINPASMSALFGRLQLLGYSPNASYGQVMSTGYCGRILHLQDFAFVFEHLAPPLLVSMWQNQTIVLTFGIGKSAQR